MASQVSSKAKAITGMLLLFFFFHFFITLNYSITSYLFPSVRQTPQSSAQNERCTLRFYKYIPSDLETSWIENVKTWQETASFCVAQKKQTQQINTWIRTVSKLSKAQDDKLSTEDPDYAVANSTFSKFIYMKTCGPKSGLVEKWIEPLALSLRDPRFNEHCSPNGQQYLFSRDYVLLESNNGREHHKRVLMDLGASTFRSGNGGTSQQYFLDFYKARGITFDRVLLWEAAQVPAQRILDEVPPEWSHIYQYYNVPAAPDRNKASNPLNIMKKLTTPDDFVSYKLDIDNGPVENQFMLQLFEEPEVYTRVKEFFFEHHVFFEHLNRYWRDTSNKHLRLQDTYVLLSKLRSMGIRAHGWP